MFPSSQYGSPQATYGNIQLGVITFPIAVYGAWPQERPRQKEMLVSDWQEETETKPVIPELPVTPAINYAQEIGERNAIIRQLTNQLKLVQGIAEKRMIAEQRQVEREAMLRASKLKNIVDDEEALFILLH